MSITALMTETRPWGSFTVLEEGTGYKIKRLEVFPGHRLSLQRHFHRSEHWVVVAGTARVTCDDQTTSYSPNSHIFIPCYSRHRIENPGSERLVLIEVQWGDYLGEDDIERFADDYNRI